MNVSRPVSGFRRLLASVNCDGAWGLALLGGCALLLLPELLGEAGRMALRYERAALEAGEWWRLVTAHVTHLGPGHAVINSSGFVLAWALFARDYPPRHWLLIAAAAAAAVDAGLWLRDSTVSWYVGSSGVLHGVVAAGALAHIRRREPGGWILAAGLAAKIAYEQLAGALPFSAGLGPVVVNSHLYGMLGGLAVAVALRPGFVPAPGSGSV